MPALKVVTLDGKVITNSKLTSQANLLVMLFNPLCDHCQNETELLEKNIHLFKQSRLIMLAAPNMREQLAGFENSTHITNYAGKIWIGLDNNSTIDRLFIYNSFPQINVYNKKRKLIKIFSGDVPIDSLKRYIQ